MLEMAILNEVVTKKVRSLQNIKKKKRCGSRSHVPLEGQVWLQMLSQDESTHRRSREHLEVGLLDHIAVLIS